MRLKNLASEEKDNKKSRDIKKNILHIVKYTIIYISWSLIFLRK